MDSPKENVSGSEYKWIHTLWKVKSEQKLALRSSIHCWNHAFSTWQTKDHFLIQRLPKRSFHFLCEGIILAWQSTTKTSQKLGIFLKKPYFISQTSILHQGPGGAAISSDGEEVSQCIHWLSLVNPSSHCPPLFLPLFLAAVNIFYSR